MAGIWRQIIETPAWPHMRIHKTKAHRSLAQATKADDQQHFTGNETADVSAKEAANKHRVQDPELTLYLRAAQQTQISLTRAVDALIRYNTFVKPLELQPLPPVVKRKDTTTRHAYQRLEINLWICRNCGYRTRVNPFAKKIPRCTPFSPIINLLFAEYVDDHSTKGHNLRMANIDPLNQVVYCMRCGSYGTHRFANLHKQCKRSASGQGARLLSFQNDQHPNGGGSLYNIIHVTLEFIHTISSQPTYDGPTEPPSTTQPLPDREAMALDEIHDNILQGTYHCDSDPDIDQDDFFGHDS
jgi:rubrerythrin